MADVPSFDALMWPAIAALREKGGSATNEELLNAVIEVGGISDAVASVPHTDGRQSRLSYNLAWAKTYLKKAGALTNSQRGVWALTELGEQITSDELNAVPALVRKIDAERRVGASVDPHAGGLIEEDQAGESTTWKDRLLAVLRAMPPDAFERLAQRLLREAGFIKVEVTGRSGDGGIDGVGVLRLNLLSFITLFQCKRYSGTVGASAVRDFRGAMVGRSDKGLIITTGTYSAEARREATRDGAPAIDLLDGDQLCDLLKSLNLGVRTTLVESIAVNVEWFSHV